MATLSRVSRLGMLVFLLIFSSGSVFSVGAVAPVASSPLYTVTDLGTLPTEPGDDPSDNQILPEGINDTGQVVGRVSIYDTVYRAFIYERGQIRAVGSDVAALTAINASGQAVGFVPQVVTSTSATQSVGVIYAAGQITSLGRLPGETFSVPLGLNDAGQVVGGSGDYPFAYRDGALQALPLLPGDCSGTAYGVNNNGQIVGRSNACAAPFGSRPMLYDAAGVHDLSLPGGVSSAFAVAINDDGAVLVSSIGGPIGRAFLYSAGTYREINPGGATGIAAHAINNTGQVVGLLGGPSGLYRDDSAFVYSGGQLFDLNTLIAADAG